MYQFDVKKGEKMNYYIADIHFGHDNIRKYSRRLEEMDKTIIENWNNKISNKDDIYIQGDFSYKSKNVILYLEALKGKKHVIIGNHDSQILKNPICQRFFVEIVDIKTVIDHRTKIVCCHYPTVEQNGYYQNILYF